MKNKHKNELGKFNEIWSRWQPNTAVLDGNYHITKVDDNNKNFKIMLQHEHTMQQVEIIFADLVLASRHVDEGLRFILFSELSTKYGDDFYAQWAFFKVTNSEFLEWLSVYSGTVSDQLNLTHFVIKGTDSLLDIVASYEPEIKIQPNKTKHA